MLRVAVRVPKVVGLNCIVSIYSPVLLIWAADMVRVERIKSSLSAPPVRKDSGAVRFLPLMTSHEVPTPPTATCPKSRASPLMGAVSSGSPVIGGMGVPPWSAI